MSRSMLVQKQIRENSYELSAHLKDMMKWETSIKQKDRSLTKKKKAAPPPRNSRAAETGNVRGGGTVTLQQKMDIFDDAVSSTQRLKVTRKVRRLLSSNLSCRITRHLQHTLEDIIPVI